jgi:8-oxo-dGTP pyrophosphatase MutT (NUDIX family)
VSDEGPEIRRLSSRVVYDNPWVSVTEDAIERVDGSHGEYAVVHAPHFVVVIPFDGERYHVVEQYRYPVAGRFWEFPQGFAGDGSLTPEEMAAVELAEESGLAAETLTPLGFAHSAYGRCTNGFHAFLATGLTPVTARPDAEEVGLRTGSVRRGELWQLVSDGAITDSASLAAWALLEHHRQP